MKYLVLLSALALTACTTTETSVKNYCDSYQVQLIKSTDSKEEQMKKLSENTYYQGVCN